MYVGGFEPNTRQSGSIVISGFDLNLRLILIDYRLAVKTAEKSLDPELSPLICNSMPDTE